MGNSEPPASSVSSPQDVQHGAYLSQTIQGEKRESLYTFYSANFSRGTVGSLRKRKREKERKGRELESMSPSYIWLLAAICSLTSQVWKRRHYLPGRPRKPAQVKLSRLSVQPWESAFDLTGRDKGKQNTVGLPYRFSKPMFPCNSGVFLCVFSLSSLSPKL